MRAKVGGCLAFLGLLACGEGELTSTDVEPRTSGSATSMIPDCVVEYTICVPDIEDAELTEVGWRVLRLHPEVDEIGNSRDPQGIVFTLDLPDGSPNTDSVLDAIETEIAPRLTLARPGTECGS